MSSHEASFLPPGVTPPDPPEAKAVALVFSIFMSVILLAFIGFVSVDFLADISGHPFNYGRQQPSPDVILSLESENVEAFHMPSDLITPNPQTIMMGPEVVVIYTRRSTGQTTISPDLLVDGVHHPWEAQYGDDTWFVRLQLPPGLHHVQVEESGAEFFVETLTSTERSMEEWTWHRPHPVTRNPDQCHDCHERAVQPSAPPVAGRRQGIGIWKGTASCFDCHKESQHNIRHAVLQPMPTDQCLRCHAIH